MAVGICFFLTRLRSTLQETRMRSAGMSVWEFTCFHTDFNEFSSFYLPYDLTQKNVTEGGVWVGWVGPCKLKWGITQQCIPQ